MTDELLTLSEAAQLLGVSTSTIRRYIREGLLPERRTPGGHFRLYEIEVRALVGQRSRVIYRENASADVGEEPR